jgi:hypothetical protein
LAPGDVDGGAVERSGADVGRSDLRKVLGREDFSRLGDRAFAVGLVAHVVKRLDLHLVGGVEVLALNSDDVSADVAQVPQSFLLEVALGVDPCSPVVNSVVDAGSVLFLERQRVPKYGEVAGSAAPAANVGGGSARLVRKGVVLR